MWIEVKDGLTECCPLIQFLHLWRGAGAVWMTMTEEEVLFYLRPLDPHCESRGLQSSLHYVRSNLSGWSGGFWVSDWGWTCGKSPECRPPLLSPSSWTLRKNAPGLFSNGLQSDMWDIHISHVWSFECWIRLIPLFCFGLLWVVLRHRRTFQSCIQSVTGQGFPPTLKLILLGFSLYHPVDYEVKKTKT